MLNAYCLMLNAYCLMLMLIKRMQKEQFNFTFDKVTGRLSEELVMLKVFV